MDELLKLLFFLKEPALIFAVLGLVALSYVIWQLFKILQRRDKVIESLATEVAESNVIQAKLVTLVETLVYGRRREGE